jgi:hypothetical protein
MNINQGKVFEKPAGGPYIGTIIDVVDQPQTPTAFGLKDKVRFLWVLAHINGAPYLDKEGQPFTIAGFYNATMSDNSNLTKVLRQILNAQPPLITNTEDLTRLVLGRSNGLYLTQEPDKKNPNELATFVAGVTPLPAGVQPPQAPVGFVRFKDKPKTQAGPNGRPVQTYAQPPAQPASFQQPPAAPQGQYAPQGAYVPPAAPQAQQPGNNVSLNAPAGAPESF